MATKQRSHADSRRRKELTRRSLLIHNLVDPGHSKLSIPILLPLCPLTLTAMTPGLGSHFLMMAASEHPIGATEPPLACLTSGSSSMTDDAPLVHEE